MEFLEYFARFDQGIEIEDAKFVLTMLMSMLPIVELRGGLPFGVALGLPVKEAFWAAVIGNMLPVPIIYMFARKVLIWGADKKFIGKFFTYCLTKGEHGGQNLVAKTGRGGLFLALLLFVGIPLPGTGAWTGTLAASFLNMGFKSTSLAVSLGVILAGIIMGIGSHTALHVFGL